MTVTCRPTDDVDGVGGWHDLLDESGSGLMVGKSVLDESKHMACIQTAASPWIASPLVEVKYAAVINRRRRELAPVPGVLMILMQAKPKGKVHPCRVISITEYDSW